MKHYIIDFAGSTEIVANSEQDAVEIFWNLILNEDKALPLNLYEIQGVEEGTTIE